MILLSDLRKMSDADLITAASEIIYDEHLWNTGFIMDAKPNEEFKQLRDVIDELHYRHVLKKLTTAPRIEPLTLAEPVPAS